MYKEFFFLLFFFVKVVVSSNLPLILGELCSEGGRKGEDKRLAIGRPDTVDVRGGVVVFERGGGVSI